LIDEKIQNQYNSEQFTQIVYTERTFLLEDAMKTRVASLVIVLILASLACSLASQAIEEEPATTPAPAVEVEPAQLEPIQPESTEIPEQPNNILFEDDFSDPSSGWDRYDDTEGVADYSDNGYLIQVFTDNQFYFANPGLTDLPGDVRIEVEATKINGPDDNSFGIICRYQDVSNFYRFIATSDDYAGILLVQDNVMTNLSGENLTPITAALPGNATNNLRADCIGDTLTLFVNGEEVLSVQDSTFTDGDVGLFAGTFDIAGTEILFDNFVVSGP